LLGSGIKMLLLLFQILGKPPATVIRLNNLASKAATSFPIIYFLQIPSTLGKEKGLITQS
jgi:hypothetical protein